RSLLVRLGAAGRTVVVSSHLMAEIEAACDWLVVVRFGELVFSGPTSELLARAQAHVDVRAEDPADHEHLVAALAAGGWASDVAGDVVRVRAGARDAAPINRAAAAAGVTLAQLVVVQESLEAVFLEMTGRDDGELARARSQQAGGLAR
ncbi:MAG TPA: hypothetical protein PKB06_09980, partial [Actinotalea sp.]|nr:hypothetical protein [Actinotalea sp.]